MSEFGDVGDFHRKFGLDTSDRDGAGPRDITDDLKKFRIDFLQEELDEFKKACSEDDHEGMIDALVDLVYVAYGTAHMFGYWWPWHWRIVQQANMEKMKSDATHLGPRGNVEWDVIKPPGWQPPDHKPPLRTFGIIPAE